jgi:hypothetical protein
MRTTNVNTAPNRIDKFLIIYKRTKLSLFDFLLLNECQVVKAEVESCVGTPLTLV